MDSNPQQHPESQGQIDSQTSHTPRVIQPSPELVQELQAQQQAPAQHVAVAGSPDDPLSPTQPITPQSGYPQRNSPASDEITVGVSASQMGLNQPNTKIFNFNVRKLLTRGAVALVVLGGVFAALVFTNIITLSEFKTVNYTDRSGIHYTFKFYSKHSSKTAQSGATELVSKVSEEGKFPIALLIDSSNASKYAYVKNCSGSALIKVFDVYNSNLKQTISVCNYSQGQSLQNIAYIAGILHNNRTSVVTVIQNYSSINLTKFGLDPYQDDIRTIIASINIK